MSNAPAEKQIELHDGDKPRQRTTVDAQCSVINVPVPMAGGFGQISFMASGLRTADGVEIWTPQAPQRQ